MWPANSSTSFPLTHRYPRILKAIGSNTCELIKSLVNSSYIMLFQTEKTEKKCRAYRYFYRADVPESSRWN